MRTNNELFKSYSIIYIDNAIAIVFKSIVYLHCTVLFVCPSNRGKDIYSILCKSVSITDWLIHISPFDGDRF